MQLFNSSLLQLKYDSGTATSNPDTGVIKWETQVSWTDKNLGKQHEPELGEKTLKKKLVLS